MKTIGRTLLGYAMLAVLFVVGLPSLLIVGILTKILGLFSNDPSAA